MCNVKEVAFHYFSHHCFSVHDIRLVLSCVLFVVRVSPVSFEVVVSR